MLYWLLPQATRAPSPQAAPPASPTMHVLQTGSRAGDLHSMVAEPAPRRGHRPAAEALIDPLDDPKHKHVVSGARHWEAVRAQGTRTLEAVGRENPVEPLAPSERLHRLARVAANGAARYALDKDGLTSMYVAYPQILDGPHVDLGGEGRHEGAINVNVVALPDDVRHERFVQIAPDARALPFPDASVACVTLEGAPLRPGMADEIARILRPGGQVRLWNPKFDDRRDANGRVVRGSQNAHAEAADALVARHGTSRIEIFERGFCVTTTITVPGRSHRPGLAHPPAATADRLVSGASAPSTPGFGTVRP